MKCACCEEHVSVCGAVCLLRHTEGRFDRQNPDPKSEMYEKVCALEDEESYSARKAMRKKEAATLNASEDLVLVAPYDGIGGARRSLELLGLKPALYISLENDADCSEVVKREWPEVEAFERVEEASETELRQCFDQFPKGQLKKGLVIGGPPLRLRSSGIA